jgi:glycosyltransferase involved in cell wall biosynthesis
MNWICAQIGAREHYAIPRVLHRDRKLAVLYTDFWASKVWRMAGRMTGKSALATRYHGDLADARVTSFNLQALKASRQRFDNSYEGFLQVGEAFGRSVVRDLEKRMRDEGRGTRAKECTQKALDGRRSTLDSGLIFFSYDTGFLEPARRVRALGGSTVLCQMDPSRFEVDLVNEEEKLWPGWARRSVDVPESYFARREEEWAVADLVMVNSEWTMQALMHQGVPADKIVIVPLAYEVQPVEGRVSKDRDSFSSSSLVSPADASQSSRQPSSFSPQRPLRVLFLGQVILRKGIQYLIEAARSLIRENVCFDVVGSLGISEKAITSAPSNMTFHGPVSRDRTKEFYREADLFVLPTLSDGFALTQLEAMAHGLPVIATPNCGRVVSDGVDGLIVPASEPMALAEAFQLLIQEPDRLVGMSLSARAKVAEFSLAGLGRSLEGIERKLFFQQ